MTTPHTIVVAGATSDLGQRIVQVLLARQAKVRSLVRSGSSRISVKRLQNLGADLAEVRYDRPEELERACAGGTCVIAALAGLGDVLVGAQSRLLDAAVAAGVPRFIPADFSIDFSGLPPGSNRNLDVHRVFRERLDAAPIAATSIFNGMFSELLVGAAPIVLFKLRRVLWWSDPDQPMDFTTRDDVAAFTAAAALDPSTPRAFHIAGDRLSARELCAIASEQTGARFKLLRGGDIARLSRLTRVVRKLHPADDDLYPPWQGMQYLHSMFSGLAGVPPLDNTRYPGIQWTSVRDVLRHTAS